MNKKRYIISRSLLLFLVFLLSCNGRNKNASLIETNGYKGTIVADEIYALKAGEEILNRDGNAVDAAVAMALTLSETLPSRVSLAGVGLCKVYNNGDNNAVIYDFRTPNTFVRAMNLMQNDHGIKPYSSLITIPELLANIGFKPDKILLNDIKNAPHVPHKYKNINENTSLTDKDTAELMTKLRLDPIRGYYNPVIYKSLNSSTDFYTAEVQIYNDKNIKNTKNIKQGTTEFAVTDKIGNAVVCSLSIGELFGSGKMTKGIITPMNIDDYSPTLSFEIKQNYLNQITTSNDDRIDCDKKGYCNFIMKSNAYTQRIIN